MIKVQNYQYNILGAAQSRNVSFSGISGAELRARQMEREAARGGRIKKLEKSSHTRGVLGGLITLASGLAAYWSENLYFLFGLVPAILLINSSINLSNEANKTRKGL